MKKFLEGLASALLLGGLVAFAYPMFLDGLILAALFDGTLTLEKAAIITDNTRYVPAIAGIVLSIAVRQIKMDMYKG